MDSQAFSWKYVTADEKLETGPCELLYAYVVPSGATTDSAIYNGSNTSGVKVVDLKDAVVTGHAFKPPVPVFCNQGLFVDIGTAVTGVFVQWRKL